jgi:hypothetical protein
MGESKEIESVHAEILEFGTAFRLPRRRILSYELQYNIPTLVLARHRLPAFALFPICFFNTRS